MFTGIVEETGKVVRAQKRGLVTLIEIEADKVCHDVKIGDSICVDGACLTVVGIKGKVLSFEAIPETLLVTTLKSLKAGAKVNLERALKVGDRLGGHFVTGHIDCTGTIRSRRILRGNLEFQIGIPVPFLKFIIKKGSVAVDGISLTIAATGSGAFSVCIIPHTAEVTTLGSKHAGDKVNVELDMLAKREE